MKYCWIFVPENTLSPSFNLYSLLFTHKQIIKKGRAAFIQMWQQRFPSDTNTQLHKEYFTMHNSMRWKCFFSNLGVLSFRPVITAIESSVFKCGSQWKWRSKPAKPSTLSGAAPGLMTDITDCVICWSERSFVFEWSFIEPPLASWMVCKSVFSSPRLCKEQEERWQTVSFSIQKTAVYLGQVSRRSRGLLEQISANILSSNGAHASLSFSQE